MTSVDLSRLSAAYSQAKADLLAERVSAGHWVGELATSSLSTATAVSALSLLLKAQETSEVSKTSEVWPIANKSQFEKLVADGVRYLGSHQNADGGWGDTDKSFSNISTTMLAVAALHLAGRAVEFATQIEAAQRYIDSRGGIPGLRRRYGKDKTFAVPILTNYALAGLVPWSEVSPLPFELACLPQSFYRFVRLPVVSYAIPALVAIGQARYFHRKPWNPILRMIRAAAVKKSLDVLRRMQPASGGYLEAVPLTSFVVMSLAATGRATHAVTQSGIQFLIDSVRPDGSWPIDTNLATWTTTLAINALSAEQEARCAEYGVIRAQGGETSEVLKDFGSLNPSCSVPCGPYSVLNWLLSCQHRERHPFTGADPGGWGWSDLSGAVPDADDTPGALLALAVLRKSPVFEQKDGDRIRNAVIMGLQWLLGLQNRDGGWPTFCRGWGTLPFDRSGADLTAHAIRAIYEWRELKNEPGLRALDSAMERGFAYLARQQRPDDSWLPLWFGNQCYPDDENPVYGTAKVLTAYRDTGRMECEQARRGIAWLAKNQNSDGGWGNMAENAGGNPTRNAAENVENRRSGVEETALGLEGLLAGAADPALKSAIMKGLDWLIHTVETRQHRECSPIGFYFAKLWYYERLYPLTFTVSALGQGLRWLESTSPRQTVTSPKIS